MESKCIRCGENMILDCQLSLSEGIGSIYKKRHDYYVHKGEELTPNRLPIAIAVCPECGYVEPYVKYPKKLQKQS